MSKHTPGPWLIKEATIFSRHPEHKKCLQGIAYVYGLSDFYMSNANTRLVAAAPELLNLAELVVDLDTPEDMAALYDIATNLLAKVRGEE